MEPRTFGPWQDLPHRAIVIMKRMETRAKADESGRLARFGSPVR